MRPSTITPTRLQVRKMLSRSCVIMTTVSLQLLLQVQHQLIEGRRADRIEPGGGLIEKQQRGVQRQRTGERGALDHAAGELRGVLAGRIRGQAHQADLEQRELIERGAAELEMLDHGQLHVLQYGQRREQRALLEGHAVAGLDGRSCAALMRVMSAPPMRTVPPAGAAGRGWSAAAPTCRRPSRRRCRTPRPARPACRVRRARPGCRSGSRARALPAAEHQMSIFMNSTANSASARITRKIACTTATVTRRPSSRDESRTCMP